MAEISEFVIPLVGIFATFGSTTFILFLLIRSRHKQRMAMIEHGLTPDMFKRSSRSIASNLKYGMFLVAIGVAMIFGYILESATRMDDGEGYFPMLSIFGGLSLLAYYAIAKNRINNEEI